MSDTEILKQFRDWLDSEYKEALENMRKSEPEHKFFQFNDYRSHFMLKVIHKLQDMTNE